MVKAHETLDRTVPGKLAQKVTTTTSISCKLCKLRSTSSAAKVHTRCEGLVKATTHKRKLPGVGLLCSQDDLRRILCLVTRR